MFLDEKLQELKKINLEQNGTVVARVRTALQADLLTTTRLGDGLARQRRGLRSELAVCFGDDLVAHEESR